MVSGGGETRIDVAFTRSVASGLLAVLAVAFAGRVAAQLVQWFTEVSWLPPFDRWQSGALPYGALVAAQIAIIGVMATIISRVHRGGGRLGRRWMVAIGFFAVGYFAFMAFRLLAGLTFAEGGWFDHPLPSTFHLVLASFLLVWVAWSRRPAP